MHRAARAVIAIGALFAAGCSNHAPQAPVSANWPMYQRTADHNTVLPQSTIAEGWAFNAGGQINGGLSVAGDVLFVDTLAGDLFALDGTHRRVLWHTHVAHAIMTAPLLWHGMVFIGSGSAGLTRKAAALWGSRRTIMGVDGGDAIYAYESRTGALRWTYHTDGEDMPTPAIAGNALIFANGDFHAYALDVRTGRLLWKRDLRGLATMASTAIGQGRAFVSVCDYRFPYRCETDALDPGSGKLLWRAPFGNADASPAYAQGSLFVSGLDYAKGARSWPFLQQAYAVIAALDAATGRPRWVYRDPVPSLPTNTGSAERCVAGTYADGTYFQALPGRSVLIAFDARSGRIRWMTRTLGPVKMSPVSDGKYVYAGDNAGLLYALRASSGAIDRVRAFRQPFSSAPPVLSGPTILFAAGNTVFSLRKSRIYRGPLPFPGSPPGDGKDSDV
jgi:outer membrane protein assembly factor BamB